MLTYTNIQHEFRKANNLTCNEYVLADMIHFLSNKNDAAIKGWCFASREHLAEEIGLSKQSVLNLIERLLTYGLLEKDEATKFLRTTAKWSRVYYTDGKESLPKVKKVENIGKESLSSGKESLPESGKESLPYNNTLYNNSNNNSNNQTSFDIFWLLYDKKTGDKDKLKKKWESFKEAERVSAIAHIPQYVLSTPDKAYRKNPSTYLNNKSWNDEIVFSGIVKKISKDPQQDFTVGNHANVEMQITSDVIG